MTTKTSKKGFIARVMDKLTGGDEAKISRFQAKAVKSWKAQSALRESEISDLNEKVSDLEEKYEETAIAVDLDRIKSVDGMDSYIQSYTTSLNNVQKEIEGVKAQIETKKSEIARFAVLIDTLS